VFGFVRCVDLKKEYARLIELFSGCDENKVKLLDGLIVECARCKKNLDDINSKIRISGGLVRVNPSNKYQVKISPLSVELTKIRANYTNMITNLCRQLSINIEDDDELNDFE
jgi:hypothetical protein